MRRSLNGLPRGAKDAPTTRRVLPARPSRVSAASRHCPASRSFFPFFTQLCGKTRAPSQSGARARAMLRIGLLIPLSGPAGIWGPSAHKCATLAVDEINDSGGVLGRSVELVVRDAGAEPKAVAKSARSLVEEHGAEAIVGMHISAVRVAVVRALAGRVPFVYTPLYEGGERSAAVFAIGETPEQQLKPAITWLAERRKARRWYLIGNDYVWPRMSHAAAKRYIAQCGGVVVGEEYVPLGTDEFSPSLDRIRAAAPHAVLTTLVGGDGITFHRRFAAESMAADHLRLSSALDENALLGVGADNAENLFAASGYFAALRTRANQGFIERYQQSFGPLAPMLSALGQSVYEGFCFYAALAARAASLDAIALEAAAASFDYEAARGTVTMRNKRVHMANYLAEADGLDFRIIDTLT
jgi:urea transport system substrate-binding protein